MRSRLTRDVSDSRRQATGGARGPRGAAPAPEPTRGSRGTGRHRGHDTSRSRQPRGRLRIADPRRFRRAVGVLLVVLATLVTMASTMRGGDGDSGAMASAEALELAAPLVSGTPARQVLAQRDSVVLYVPIAQGAITGIAYHPVEGSSAISLDPVGEQQNAGLVRRALRSLFGES